jgi:hypothetical protein
MKNIKKMLILFVLTLGLLLGVAYQFKTIDKQSELIRWQRDIMHQMCDKLDQRSHELASLTRYGGFMEIPVPEDGKPLYLLIIQSFNGGAVFPKSEPPDIDLLNTRFYVAYDMENKRFLALQDSSIGFSGKDFVMVISREPNGTRVTRPLKGEQATALCDKFNLGFGPTRY